MKFLLMTLVESFILIVFADEEGLTFTKIFLLMDLVRRYRSTSLTILSPKMNANLPWLDFTGLSLLPFSVLLPLIRKRLSSLLLFLILVSFQVIDFLQYYHFHYRENLSEFRESFLISHLKLIF